MALARFLTELDELAQEARGALETVQDADALEALHYVIVDENDKSHVSKGRPIPPRAFDSIPERR